jgi:hypothetical protein
MDPHEEIWLQPWCPVCNLNSYEGRMWCQDNVWDRCEECGEKPVKYVLAPLTAEQRNRE